MPEVKFVERRDESKPAFNVGIMLNRKETKGEVGIEIEVEGNKFPKPPGNEQTHIPVKLPGTSFWSYVKDNSLRGQDNAEYILTKPIEFSKAGAAIDEIYNKLKDYGSVLDESNRTSVHVHLNCQEFHLNRLAAFMAMWFALEEPLTEWCGEHRVGNLFCLRAIDAPAVITHLRRFIKSDGKWNLHDQLRYGALNPNALFKYGSLEIRTLQGSSNPVVVKQWLEILHRLYDLSADFTDPRDAVALFSSGGPLYYFGALLGEHVHTVRAGINWTDNQIAQAVYRGIRFAQDLCYCRDWDTFKGVTLKTDPFGRDSRKLAPKIASIASPAAPVNTLSAEYMPEPEYDDYVEPHDPFNNY